MTTTILTYSPYLMEALNSMRHVAIHDPAVYEKKRVAIIGVGTIGSNLALLLARMQVPITVYDHDTVEEHNLTTQTYGRGDLGKFKVQAVVEQVMAINPKSGIKAKNTMFELGEDKYDLIVSAVDSITARRDIASALMDGEVTTPIVDGRVGAEQLEVYYFPTATEWLAQLPQPEEADTDPCGARFTAYTAVLAAGFMANYIKKFLMEQTIHANRIIFDAASLTFIKE